MKVHIYTSYVINKFTFVAALFCKESVVSVSPKVTGMFVLAVVSGVVPPVGSVSSHLSPGIMHIKYHTMIL